MTRTWIPLESNPEVLTEFAGKLGLDSTKWQFSDVFGLDPVRLRRLAA
jgi:ubiquitin carboxyl-terminal hydrolase L3